MILQCQEIYKENFQIKGIFGFKKQQELTLNLSDYTLSYQKKKDLVVFQLNLFEITNLGLQQKRYCIKIQSRFLKKKKKLIIGQKDENIQLQWFNQMNKIAQPSDQSQCQDANENMFMTNQSYHINEFPKNITPKTMMPLIIEFEGDYMSLTNNQNIQDFQNDLMFQQIKEYQVESRIKPCFAVEYNIDRKHVDQRIQNIINGFYLRKCINSFHQMQVVPIKNNQTMGICKFYERAEKGSLNYNNKILINNQRAVLASLLKKIGSTLLKGQFPTNIPIPLSLFEPLSMLERFSQYFGYAPYFLEKAGLTFDPVEQLKLVTAFVIATINLQIRLEKPFNPILGETYQGCINGILVYMEQISHHPPICYYLIKGENFTLSGSYEPTIHMSLNSLHTAQNGIASLDFHKTNTKVKFIFPTFQVSGTAMGQRSVNFVSRAQVFNETLNLFGEVIFNVKDEGIVGMFKKQDYMIDEIGGQISIISSQSMANYLKKKEKWKHELQKNEIQEIKSKIKGFWCSHVEFDGIKYWDIQKDLLYDLIQDKNPLPSDSTYRFDILYARIDDEENSQNEKHKLEEIQRHDVKLRKK